MKFLRLAALTAALLRAGEPEPADWGRVLAVPPGTRLEVIHVGLKRLRGDLVSVSPQEIAVQSEGARTVVAKPDVVRVSVVKNDRKNRALLGLVLGAGAGAAALAIGAQAGDIDIRRDLVVGAGALAGGGIGAVVGAAAGGGSTTIYRRP